MEIIPVIYILDGRVAALYKGDLDQKSSYAMSPLEFAVSYERQGAKKIFIVDLNASEELQIVNKEILIKIRAQVNAKLMYGGGIRTMPILKDAFDLGMDEVVLGVSAEPIYKEAVEMYSSEKIFAGIKSKGDEVITDIKREFPLRVIDFAEKLSSQGITHVVFKDLRKEGTMIHPNYDEIDRMISMTPLGIYVSGGIGDIKHLRLLQEIGTKGAIIGKAFYERELDLASCIREFDSE